MKVVDSSLWVEWMAKGPLYSIAKPLLDDPREVLVPWIVLMEVYKFTLRHRGGTVANRALGRMMLSPVDFPDVDIAVRAGQLCVLQRLPTADATVLAHAQRAGLVLVTCDEHFAGIENVEYYPKTSPPPAPR